MTRAALCLLAAAAMGTAAAQPAPEWTLTLAAGDHAAGVVGGHHRDGGNVVGMAAGATDGLDAATDAPEPGAPGGDHVQLYVRGPAADAAFGDRYMQQVVAARDLTDAHYDFALVVSAVGYGDAEVGVEATDVGAVPAGYDLFLIDEAPDAVVHHDLRAGPYAFTYSGVRTLTLRVGRLPDPELPPDPVPPGTPEGPVTVGKPVPFTWDPQIRNTSEIAIQSRRPSAAPARGAAAADWVDLVTGIDPRVGTFDFVPPADLVGEVSLRSVARNGRGTEVELARTSVVVDYGAPAGSFDEATGGLSDPDLTVGTPVAVPFTALNSDRVSLAYSPDGGATWTTVAGPVTNPNADLSQPWTSAFGAWSPGPDDVSYGGLFRLALEIDREPAASASGTGRRGVEVTYEVSSPVTVVPTSLPWSLGVGFEMVGLPFDAGAQTPDDVFASDGVPLASLFVYSYEPATFYTLLDNDADTFPAGRGVWAASQTGGGGEAGGTFARADVDVALGQNGWVMVGAPFALPVRPDAFTFTDGVQTKTYAEAVAAFWIGAGLYAWDAAGAGYVDVAGGTLAPWDAGWLPVYADGLTLTVAPPAPAAPARQAGDDPFWALVAEVEHTDGRADRSTAFGVHPDAAVGLDAHDRPEPPPPPTPDAVRAYSARPEWGAPFAQFDREAQPAPAEGEARTWPLVIEAPAGEVTVTWRIPAPADGDPALTFERVDPDTGARTPLADGDTFLYDSDGTPREVPIVATAAGSVHAEPPAPAAFAVRLAPNPAGSAAAALVTAPEPGDVVVRVFDVLGRRVADVRERVPAGASRVALPVAALAPGAYLVRIEGPGGAATRRLTVHR